MWCPQDYYSWNYVVDHLFETSREILSLVALGGEPPEQGDGKRFLIHTAEFYLKSRGFADGYKDAELSVAITTCFLLCKFLEDYPPVLANLQGNNIIVNPVFFEHRDQLNCCVYAWPLEADTQYCNFYEFNKAGVFKPSNIFDRFVFIDPISGEVRVKNGVKEFLNGYVTEDDSETDRIIDLAKCLSGYVVCWPDIPDDSEYRNFLSYLEINDAFIRALDYSYGPAAEANVKPERRPVGRPSKQDATRSAYWKIFPDGHEKSGKVWKEAHAEVEQAIDMPIHITTLKRAVR